MYTWDSAVPLVTETESWFHVEHAESEPYRKDAELSKVNVMTIPQPFVAGRDSPISNKETDLDLPGNRRWLVSHIRWAARFGHQVVVTPN